MHWIDPSCLPASRGVVKRFIPNPSGDLDGLVLIGDIVQVKKPEKKKKPQHEHKGENDTKGMPPARPDALVTANS